MAADSNRPAALAEPVAPPRRRASAYVLALIAGIGEMIPVVGPILSAIPALIVALTVRPTLALFVLVFFILQQQFENHVLVPKIMSRQVGISAVIIIVSLLIGGSLLGIVGAILAVPTAAVLQVLYEELSSDNMTKSGVVSGSQSARK